MRPRSPDEVDYKFLTASRAVLTVRSAGEAEVEIAGNRAGLLSLANVFLWLAAHASRREVLSLGELPFARVEPPLALCLRVTARAGTGQDGRLELGDRGDQLDWVIAAVDLERVALALHRLVARPSREPLRLAVAEEGVAGIHVVMTDATLWVKKGHAG